MHPNDFPKSIKDGLLKIYNRFPFNPKLKDRARELRRNMTRHEKILWYEFLSKHPVRFQRQKTIGHYIADFYCGEAKLIIEIDGDTHFDKEQAEYDLCRDNLLKEYGIQILRFTNGDIENRLDFVCAEINKVVSKTKNTSQKC